MMDVKEELAPEQYLMHDVGTQEELDIEYGHWKAGFCGCCSNLERCLLVFCCPVCCGQHMLVTKTAPVRIMCLNSLITKDQACTWVLVLILCCFLPFLVPILMVLLMASIVHKFRVMEGFGTTFIKVWCCLPCYTMQVINHVDMLEKERRMQSPQYGAAHRGGQVALSNEP
eukprot:TRINITY_DN1681_c0_g1_i1.p1 TRINITY_DN1681_c0_g1~~TRINITY_DN1681_c0_g1_i1.p1  ORF type:complete len:199 (-),score=14.64 TRINITY_DN1681_c0_g1_i1:396-908(-)